MRFDIGAYSLLSIIAVIVLIFSLELKVLSKGILIDRKTLTNSRRTIFFEDVVRVSIFLGSGNKHFINRRIYTNYTRL